MNLKRDIINWIKKWKIADYSEGLQLAIAIGTPNKVIKHLLKRQEDRLKILNLLGHSLKTGGYKERTPAQEREEKFDGVANSQSSPIVPPPVINTTTNALQIPETVSLEIENNRLVTVIISKHAKLSTAKSDLERAHILAEITSCNKKRGENSKAIKLINNGIAPTVALDVSKKEGDIYEIPEGVDIYPKIRRLTRQKSAAKTLLTKYSSDPEKSKKYNDKISNLQKAIEILRDADKKFKEN